jgi:hypothetical protein
MLEDVSEYAGVLAYAFGRFQDSLNRNTFQCLNDPRQQAGRLRVERIAPGCRNETITVQSTADPDYRPNMGRTKLKAPLENVYRAVFEANEPGEIDRLTSDREAVNRGDDGVTPIRIQASCYHHVSALPLLRSSTDFGHVFAILDIRELALGQLLSAEIDLDWHKTDEVLKVCRRISSTLGGLRMCPTTRVPLGDAASDGSTVTEGIAAPDF